MINIQPRHTGKTAFLHLGFRPFFFSALAFGVVSMILWMMIYSYHLPLLPKNYPIYSWHAHEMIFGFASAVVTGFLLTAVKNWTGIQTINHKPLLAVFIIWLLARILVFVPFTWALPVLAVVDSLFFLLVTVAFSYPVFKVKQWKNLAFSGKLFLLLIANIIFYLGLLGYYDQGINYGLYGGLYLILAVIFNMGRRVIPFFIEKGLGVPSFQTKNYHWVDISSLWIFLAFSIADIVWQNSLGVAILAGALAIMHSARLYGWYHNGIWKKSLLWSLAVGYAWIVMGFALKAATFIFDINPYISIHAFTVGGIAMVTAGMMARVSLGHTGNNVFDPPKVLHLIFAILFMSAIIRVILPLFFSQYYPQLIISSQVLWIISFALFFIKYAPMLIKSRVDGNYG